MPGKFLVASANTYTVRAIEIALKDEKHTPIVARDGLEVVDVALDQSPNAVFLGVELEGLEGLDVARALRALDPTEHMPIIFLAENPEQAKRVHDARLPLTEVLTAPYDLADVKVRAHAALRAEERIAELRQHATDPMLYAITDPLTRLYNRRYLLHRLAYESTRSVRYTTPLALMLIDVDNLADINTDHGILYGDMVLIEVSQLLKKLVRVSDVVGRCNTQDFLVLMPQTDETGARMLADRIWQAVAQHHFVANKLDLHVTVSVGVACAAGGDLTENLALVGRGEGALDRAKQAGKNRVEMG
jgi:two-component system, cell cycle response regulator